MNPQEFYDLLAVTLGAITVLATMALGFMLRPRKEEPPAALPQKSGRGQGAAPRGDSFSNKAPCTEEYSSWLLKLREGMAKTRSSLLGSIEKLLGQGKTFDQDTLHQIHEVLYRADVGVRTCDKIVQRLHEILKQSGKDQQGLDLVTLQVHLAQVCLELVAGAAGQAGAAKALDKPQVILLVGVNGVGKTTTAGKLAAHYLAEGRSVLLAAADTYRAAAIDQLKIWGERLGLAVIAHQPGADPAAVAFDGVKAAKARDKDILIVDTAGRLANKVDLMNELAKIKKVIAKEHTLAPHEVWLVIDATTGQNAFAQVKAFTEVVALTGLIVTKLDGTAKGGVILGIYDQFQLPIQYVGVGEKAADLRPFDPADYVNALFQA